MTDTRTTATYDLSKNGTSDQLKGLLDVGKETLATVKDKLVEAKDVVVDKAESMASMMAKTIKAHPSR